MTYILLVFELLIAIHIAHYIDLNLRRAIAGSFRSSAGVLFILNIYYLCLKDFLFQLLYINTIHLKLY